MISLKDSRLPHLCIFVFNAQIVYKSISQLAAAESSREVCWPIMKLYYMAEDVKGGILASCGGWNL